MLFAQTSECGDDFGPSIVPISRLLPLVDRFSTFRLCLPAFQKVLRMEERSKLRVEFQQRFFLAVINRQMSGHQCSLDA